MVVLYRLDSDKYFIDKLTVDHVDHITDYWTDTNKDLPTIKNYLSHVLTVYNYSTGIFLRSRPSNPVSWVAYGDFGHIIHQYTLPEYRQNCLSLIALIDLYKQLAEDGIVGVAERSNSNFLGKTLNAEVKFISDYTWRDSITGECYW